MSEVQITGRTNGRKATMNDYETLFQPQNRPLKFAPGEVGFVNPSPGAFCSGCAHWFVNGPQTEIVCEIMRFPDERNIPGTGACRFQNTDGVTFPLLKVL